MQYTQGIYDNYNTWLDSEDCSNFEYYNSKRNSRMHYEIQNKQHVFITEIYGEDGWQEYFIYSTFEVVYEVQHGSYSSYAETPDDYFDTLSAVAWEIVSVVDDENNEVNPKNFLTEEEYKRYTASLDEFVGNF